MSSLYIKLIAAAAVLSIIGLAYWHYTTLLDQIQEMQGTIATQDTAIKLKETELAIVKKDASRVNKATEELNASMQAVQGSVESTRALLAGHDLNNLMEKKPNLLSRRMQKGTVERFKSIEEASKL